MKKMQTTYTQTNSLHERPQKNKARTVAKDLNILM